MTEEALRMETHSRRAVRHCRVAGVSYEPSLMSLVSWLIVVAAAFAAVLLVSIPLAKETRCTT